MGGHAHPPALHTVGGRCSVLHVWPSPLTPRRRASHAPPCVALSLSQPDNSIHLVKPKQYRSEPSTKAHRQHASQSSKQGISIYSQRLGKRHANHQAHTVCELSHVSKSGETHQGTTTKAHLLQQSTVRTTQSRPKSRPKAVQVNPPRHTRAFIC